MYKVYLADPLVTMKVADYKDIYFRIKGYFNSITAKLKSPDTAEVVWCAGVPSPAPDELLLYFTPPDFSVASQFTKKPSLAQRAGVWGYTTPEKGDDRVGPWVSEVYVRQLNPKYLAKVAFHELMHNKLRLFDDELHKKNGLAVKNIDFEKVDISPENISDVASALKKPTPQWMGGFSIMVTARIMRDGGTADWNRGAY